ncbi:MAG: hypothetical protein GX811_04125 [Lentisphaerae bacterium]|nr:hypothetical protein [Lentisphaerota bacterium]
MYLTYEQIKSFTSAAIRIEQKDNRIVFHRIPPILAQRYAAHEHWNVRMNCPSGVRINFLSDTRFIKISLNYRQFARHLFQGNLIVDNNSSYNFGPDAYTPAWSGEIFQQQNREFHQFEIWLPHLAENELVYLEVEDGSELKSVSIPELNWLVYGDSITQGMNATVPINGHISLCARELNADFLNLGIGGEIFADELSEDIPDYNWDFATIAYGVNDWAKNILPALMAEKAVRLLKTLKQKRPDNQIFLISPLSTVGRDPENDRGLTLDDYREALKTSALETETMFIDGTTLVPAEAEFFADGLHPNDAGFKVYAENLLIVIKQHI